MKKIFFAALLSMGTMAAVAQTEVTPFVPGSTLEGVSYFLPKTALRMVVEVEKTTVIPGDLSKYAFRYLRLNDVPREGSTTYQLKSVKLDTYGVPDSKKAYSIKVKSKSIAPLVGLTDDGILLSINREPEPMPAMSPVPVDVPAAPLVDPRKYYTQEMLAAGSTSKLAELVSQEIYDMRESRNELIRGEADNTPKDGAQLQLMLNQLDQQAAALESLFKGTVSRSTHYVVLNVVPDAEKEVIAFRMSKHQGVVAANDLSGEPVYLSLESQHNIPASLIDPSVTKKKEKMEKGIYYNVPARETVKVYTDEKTYVNMDCPMAQFGTTEVLSDVLFNKNSTFKVSFYPQTGAIEKQQQ